jgi:chitin disaccharide deacetylase
VIFRGDDFGLSLEVNEAVEQAHTNGVLSTASLMVGAPAAADAVQRARRLPRLRVGLHVVVARGQAVLLNHEIPALTEADGRFLIILYAWA